MKTTKEVKIDGRTYTVFECQNCGSTTRTTGRHTAKKAQAALTRECRSCSPVRLVDPVLVGGRSSVYLRILMSMDQCSTRGRAKGTGLKKPDGWVGLRGPGRMNTRKNEKALHRN